MGNEVQKCCKNCIRLEPDEFTTETRFMQITGNFNKSLRCRKFFISSQALQKQKINELLIFTDASLTMSIPNFNLKLQQEEIEKLEEAIKFQIYNNNLAIRQNCFVLNPIQQQPDSDYGEFKQFPQNQSLSQDNEQSRAQNTPVNAENNKQKLKNQIEQFALRNKSRAFRFRNPLKKYQISQIIVAIVPIFQKPDDLNALKQAVEQGLSMSEDLKSVGVSEISFMLGYEQTVFQKIIIEYILGYSRSRKQYVFKRMNEFVYLTRSHDQINSFFKFLNIYTKSRLQKVEGKQTTGRDKQAMIRKLGSNGQKDKKPQTITSKNPLLTNPTNLPNINKSTPQPTNPQQQTTQFYNAINNSFDTSYHSYGQRTNLIGFTQQKANNSNLNVSGRNFQNNINDISEIGSRNSETSEIKNIRIKSFKSKDSNVSDYF